ncbi:MAG: GNAT family N-acetyltransferase [Ahrensia sp.]|nr:GNAT family N-acetyltransferase [Ahrensia sp.]
MTGHKLDRPIWAALTSKQAYLSSGGPEAMRFPADISPFAATPDDDPESLARLAALIPSGAIFVTVAKTAAVPPQTTVEKAAPLIQMHAVDLVAAEPGEEVIALGDDDAREMLELATLTRPGPFLINTHRLGRFIGVRKDGRLAAMAGERLHVDGYREVSAVCTHPDFRGRGYAGLLSRIVANRIKVEGETPFLHAYADNAAAIRLYESLGFRIERELVVQMLRRD